MRPECIKSLDVVELSCMGDTSLRHLQGKVEYLWQFRAVVFLLKKRSFLVQKDVQGGGKTAQPVWDRQLQGGKENLSDSQTSDLGDTLVFILATEQINNKHIQVQSPTHSGMLCSVRGTMVKKKRGPAQPTKVRLTP